MTTTRISLQPYSCTCTPCSLQQSEWEIEKCSLICAFSICHGSYFLTKPHRTTNRMSFKTYGRSFVVYNMLWTTHNIHTHTPPPTYVFRFPLSCTVRSSIPLSRGTKMVGWFDKLWWHVFDLMWYCVTKCCSIYQLASRVRVWTWVRAPLAGCLKQIEKDPNKIWIICLGLGSSAAYGASLCSALWAISLRDDVKNHADRCVDEFADGFAWVQYLQTRCSKKHKTFVSVRCWLFARKICKMRVYVV